MSKINEIINDYTSGKTPVEETNAALKEACAGFHFEPGRNTLTAEEIAATVGGPRPQDADGWGLLDTGTGTLDNVQVKKGKLMGGPVNTVGPDGMPNEKDLVYIGGQTWQVYGDTLGAVLDEDEPWWVAYRHFVNPVDWREELPQYIPEKEMIFDRAKYHGVEVVRGSIRYLYAEDGSCQYQPESMFEYDKDHGRV